MESGDSHPREFPSLEITTETEILRPRTPSTIDELNEILRELDFPTIEERMLDDHLALIDVLNNLRIEYGRYGLEVSSELNEMRTRQEKISFYNECERECDVLEIEYANLKQRHNERSKYEGYDMNDLRYRLDELRWRFNDMEYERSSKILNKIFRFLRNECTMDMEIISAFSYIKETREYFNSIEKATIMDEIENGSDSHDRSIFKQLISQESIGLDDLGKSLNLDRTTLLKIIYNLLSKNIIVFNRSKDIISLNK